MMLPRRTLRRSNPSSSDSSLTSSDFDAPSTHSSDRLHTSPKLHQSIQKNVNETPLAKKLSGTDPYTSMHYNRDLRMACLGSEMKGKFVGPISAPHFLRTFLPFEEDKPPRRMKKNFISVAAQSSEQNMYQPMINALRPFCPGFELVDTHDHLDVNGKADGPIIKPDVCLYDVKNEGERKGVTDSSLMELFMEFKFHAMDDPFSDTEPFEHSSRPSKDTRGQITAYMTALLANQFRTHAFAVVICRDQARLMYWDRSAAVVTESFSYIEKPWLASFFWRYSHLPLEARGIDTTVTKPTDADKDDVDRAKVALELKDEDSVLKFAVYDDEKKDVTYCFGNKAWFKGTGSPTGRGTRIFVVYYPALKKLVLLKDTWRISIQGFQPEGAVYRRLHDANVSNIPLFLRGGDVDSRFSHTRSYKLFSELCVGLRPHCHYRLLLDDIGRDLTSFETTKELVTTMAGAMQAHTEAFEKARILHRDISVGNIIISNRGGLLIDWDVSKDVDDLGKISRQPYRTGTWQFIAARLLSSESSEGHTQADDLESFFHVLCWVVLRFTRHCLSPADLSDYMATVYDHYYMDSGEARSGEQKADFIVLEKITSEKISIPQGPLRDLLADLTDVLGVRYKIPPSEGLENAYERATSETSSQAMTVVLEQHPVKVYRDRLCKLTGSWMTARFREAAFRNDWDTGRRGRRHKNTLVHIDEEAIRRKRTSEYVVDAPRQAKKYKATQSAPEVINEPTRDGSRDTRSIAVTAPPCP